MAPTASPTIFAIDAPYGLFVAGGPIHLRANPHDSLGPLPRLAPT